ncbi:MAG: hypothetical protein WD002_04670 [Pseudomonadales bacterium]
MTTGPTAVLISVTSIAVMVNRTDILARTGIVTTISTGQGNARRNMIVRIVMTGTIESAAIEVGASPRNA